MKTNIEIDFVKINHFKVNKNLLKKNPKLIEITEETVKELCTYLKKYFKEKRIVIKIDYVLQE